MVNVLERLAAKFAVQTAVYWGNPIPAGTGGYTYDNPIEIAVRWDDVSEKIAMDNGEEKLSRAMVTVTQDVDLGGLLFLGTLADLDSGEEGNPETIAKAYEIIKFDKIPMILKTDDHWRMARVI